MMRRRCEGFAVEKLLGPIVVHPVFPRLVAGDDGVLRLARVWRGVLRGRVVTTADVPALGATPQVQPPPTGPLALDTARSARWDRRVDSLLCHHVQPLLGSALRDPSFRDEDHGDLVDRKRRSTMWWMLLTPSRDATGPARPGPARAVGRRTPADHRTRGETRQRVRRHQAPGPPSGAAVSSGTRVDAAPTPTCMVPTSAPQGSAPSTAFALVVTVTEIPG